MTVKIILIDGTLTIDRNLLESCNFFNVNRNFIKTDEYVFDVTQKEFYIVISYIINKSLPKVGNYTDNLKKLADFLILEDLLDFLLTDSEYFKKYINPVDLQIIDDKNLYDYNRIISYMRDINLVNTNLVFNKSHINFYSLKSFTDYFINEKNFIDILEIDWDNMVCNCNFPYLFFSDINFYSKSLKSIEKIKNKIIDLGFYLRQDEKSIYFIKNSRKFVFFKKEYPNLLDFLDEMIDSDAFYFGKNVYTGEDGLWVTKRKIRFDKYVTNLYDPRYNRHYPKNIPIEFIGTFERNQHIIKKFI